MFPHSHMGFILKGELLQRQGTLVTQSLCLYISLVIQITTVMSNSLMHLLLLPTRLSLWILSLVYYILVYGTAGITACLVLIRIALTGFRDPYGTFQWNVRKKPPDCLKDPALGDHAYLKGRVRAFIMKNTNSCLFDVFVKSNIYEVIRYT